RWKGRQTCGTAVSHSSWPWRSETSWRSASTGRTRSATATPTAAAKSSSSLSAPPTSCPARSWSCRTANNSACPGRPCSSWKGRPCGFPPGGRGLGMVSVGSGRVSDVIATIQLQVIGASLRSIAEEMGAVLIRSAFSANIKERRDCSTALFDERGRMIAQAEHIPVHLGAMPDAVAAVMRLSLEPGQVAILNDPYTGGTHLPDVTLVSRTVLGFAVSRAHHADVGGIEPASLPAFSHTLEEEGGIVPPQLFTDEVLERFVRATRQPEERRGDLRAQLASHRLAERRPPEAWRAGGRGG